MKTCDERWREVLFDHAAGKPASAELARHLLGCSSCSAALRDARGQMAEIEVGLSRLAAAEASPHAVPRAIAAVRDRHRGARVPGLRWAVPLVALAALLVAVLGYQGYMRRAREQDRQALLAAVALHRWRSPTEGLLQLPMDRWLVTPPRVGQSFYPLNETVDNKEKHPQ